jgi:signal transduction histidine kinase
VTVPALPQSGRDEPYLLVARVAVDGTTGRDVVVIVGRSIGGLAETVGLVGRMTLVAVPLLVLVVAGATYVVVGRALAPVERIRRQVMTISSQRLDERVPVPAADDEIHRLAVTMNAMLATLQAAQAAQRRFVADAGHELRSPLATMAVALEVARGEGLPDPPQAMLIDDLTAETERMRLLVDDLLFLARADEQGLRLRHVDVDLDDLVETEARRLRQAGVEVTLHSEPARVSGDPARLTQVLRNLTDNARRYAHARVHLDVRRGGDHVVMRVEDDGQGIPEPDRDRVLARFVRLDDARDRVSGGSGLGLAIVDEIVSAHGGRITLRDSALGGVSAEVRLPAPPDPT